MAAFITFLNTSGNLFAEFASSMLIQSSVLIVALLVLDFVIRKRVRAIFRYCIWMLVLAKLVLPTSLSLPTGPGYWFGDKLSFAVTEKADDQTDTAITTETFTQPTLPHYSLPTNFTYQSQINDFIGPTEAYTGPEAEFPIIPEPQHARQRQQTQTVPLTWQAFVLLGWFAVFAAMVLLMLQRLVFVRSLIRQAKDTGGSIVEIFAQCKKDMGVSRKIDLKYSPVTASPAVCGLFKPTILIPVNSSKEFDSQHLRSILLHELAHVKRNDLPVSFAQTLLQIFYFYNPLLWLANSIIRNIREQAVDEMVLVAMGDDAADYPESLLNVSRMAFSRPALSLRLIGVVESQKALATRIKHILSKPFPKSAKLGIAGLAAILIAGAVLLPMAKGQPKELKPEIDVKEAPSSIKMTAILPNDDTVTLLGVCEVPEKGNYINWWKPDGSKLEDRPFKRSTCSVKNHKGKKWYCFAYSIPDTNKSSSPHQYGIKDNFGSASGTIVAKDNKRYHSREISHELFQLPDTLEKTEFEFGFPGGPWHTLVKVKENQHTYSFGEFHALIIPAKIENGKNVVRIWEKWPWMFAHDYFKRYVIKLKDQPKLINMDKYETDVNDHPDKLRQVEHIYVLDADMQGKIEYIAAQYCTKQIATFKNISLAKNRITDFQVDVRQVPEPDFIYMDMSGPPVPVLDNLASGIVKGTPVISFHANHPQTLWQYLSGDKKHKPKWYFRIAGKDYPLRVSGHFAWSKYEVTEAFIFPSSMKDRTKQWPVGDYKLSVVVKNSVRRDPSGNRHFYKELESLPIEFKILEDGRFTYPDGRTLPTEKELKQIQQNEKNITAIAEDIFAALRKQDHNQLSKLLGDYGLAGSLLADTKKFDLSDAYAQAAYVGKDTAHLLSNLKPKQPQTKSKDLRIGLKYKNGKWVGWFAGTGIAGDRGREEHFLSQNPGTKEIILSPGYKIDAEIYDKEEKTKASDPLNSSLEVRIALSTNTVVEGGNLSITARLVNTGKSDLTIDRNEISAWLSVTDSKDTPIKEIPFLDKFIAPGKASPMVISAGRSEIVRVFGAQVKKGSWQGFGTSGKYKGVGLVVHRDAGHSCYPLNTPGEYFMRCDLRIKMPGAGDHKAVEIVSHKVKLIYGDKEKIKLSDTLISPYPVSILAKDWKVETLKHQNEARGICQKNGFLYVGGKDQVSKIKITNGSIEWSYPTKNTYQPSYPVSNGKVVVFGKYYKKEIVCLDDSTGQLKWTVPTAGQNMSAACFNEKLVFIGSYDKYVYGIDWSSGQVKWKTQLGQSIWSTPCIYKDMILIGCYDGFVYAINQASGNIVWRFNTGGRINSNPVVINDLAFISLDAQRYGEPYHSSKVQKILTIIDLKKKKVIERFTTKTKWHENALVFGKTAFFFDRSKLYSYNTEQRKLSWEIKAPPGMLPYPIISDSTITLAMNILGHHGNDGGFGGQQSKVVVYERSTGRKLISAEKGGIGMREPHYIQYNKFVVTTDWELNAYEMKRRKSKSSDTLSSRSEKAAVTFSDNEFRIETGGVRKKVSGSGSRLDLILMVTAFGNKKISLICGDDLLTVIAGPDPKSPGIYGTARVVLSANLDNNRSPQFTWLSRIVTSGGKGGGPSTTSVPVGKKLEDFVDLNIKSGTYTLGENVKLGTVEGREFFLRVDKWKKTKTFTNASELAHAFLKFAKESDPKAADLFTEKMTPECGRLLDWWEGKKVRAEIEAEFDKMRLEFQAGLTQEQKQFYSKVRIWQDRGRDVTHNGNRGYVRLLNSSGPGKSWIRTLLLQKQADSSWRIGGLHFGNTSNGVKDFIANSPATHPAWGDTVEFDVSADDIRRGCYVDFDKRRLYNASDGAGRQWLIRNGIDGKCGPREFRGGGLTCIDLKAEAATFIRSLVTPLNAQLMSNNWSPLGHCSGMFLFRTREGGIGTMIVGGSAEGFILRFKMLDSSYLKSHAKVIDAMRNEPLETAAYVLACMREEHLRSYPVKYGFVRDQDLIKTGASKKVYRLDNVYVAGDSALAITSRTRQDDYSRLTLFLEKAKGQWTVNDIQVEKKSDDGTTLEKFLKEHSEKLKASDTLNSRPEDKIAGIEAEEKEKTSKDLRLEGWKVFLGDRHPEWVNGRLTDKNQMNPDNLITVKCVDEQNRPIPYCRIVFVERDEKETRRFIDYVPTNHSGYAYCDAINGSFSITAQVFDYSPLAKAWRFQHRKIDKLHNAKDKPVITIKWPSFPEGNSRVLGAVKDQYGRPLKEFSLMLYQLQGQRKGWGECLEKQIKKYFVSPEGNFEIGNIAPGTYKYFVHPTKDYSDYTWDFDMGEVTVAAEETTQLNIEIKAKNPPVKEKP